VPIIQKIREGIQTPQDMETKFANLGKLADRLDPFNKLPRDRYQQFQNLLIAWGDTYAIAPWGAEAETLGERTTWLPSEREKWINVYFQAIDVLNYLAETPGVTLLGQAKEAQPAPGPVIKGEDIQIQAKIPWKWIAMGVGGLAALALAFGRKRQSALPNPAMAAFEDGNIYSVREGRMPDKCKILVGDVTGDKQEFDLSPAGWFKAHNQAIYHASKTGRLSLVDMACKNGRMALYQCGKSRGGAYGCVIETPQPKRTGTLDSLSRQMYGQKKICAQFDPWSYNGKPRCLKWKTVEIGALPRRRRRR
jgi:hypothetical protein